MPKETASIKPPTPMTTSSNCTHIFMQFLSPLFENLQNSSRQEESHSAKKTSKYKEPPEKSERECLFIKDGVKSFLYQTSAVLLANEKQKQNHPCSSRSRTKLVTKKTIIVRVEEKVGKVLLHQPTTINSTLSLTEEKSGPFAHPHFSLRAAESGAGAIMTRSRSLCWSKKKDLFPLFLSSAR